MRKALPVILFTILLAGCGGGGSAPVTVTKTVTVPASKPTSQRSSRSTTTSLVTPATGPQHSKRLCSRHRNQYMSLRRFRQSIIPSPATSIPMCLWGLRLHQPDRRNHCGIRALVTAWMTRCMSVAQPCLPMGQRDGLPSAPGRVRIVS